MAVKECWSIGKKIAMGINGFFIIAFGVCIGVAPFHAHSGHMTSDPFWIVGQFCMVVCLGFFLHRKLTK